MMLYDKGLLNTPDQGGDIAMAELQVTAPVAAKNKTANLTRAS